MRTIYALKYEIRMPGIRNAIGYLDNKWHSKSILYTYSTSYRNVEERTFSHILLMQI